MSEQSILNTLLKELRAQTKLIQAERVALDALVSQIGAMTTTLARIEAESAATQDQGAVINATTEQTLGVVNGTEALVQQIHDFLVAPPSGEVTQLVISVGTPIPQ